MPRSRYKILENQQPHFLTCTVVNWIAIFTRPDTVEIVLDSLRFLQNKKRLVLYGYVILENHLHLIASAENLAKEIGDFKSFTARRLIDYFEDENVTMVLQQIAHHKLRHKRDRQYQLW